jgi:hypothetical protein
MLKTLVNIFWPKNEEVLRNIPNHNHVWEHFKDEKCDWDYVNVKGTEKAAGRTVSLEIALKIVYSQENDFSAPTLVSWAENGFNAAFKNIAHWKCAGCGQKTKTYFFTEPTYNEPVRKGYFGVKKNFVFKSVDNLEKSGNLIE